MALDITQPGFQKKFMNIFDHTTLRPTDTEARVQITINEAARVGAHAVCLQPIYGYNARSQIEQSEYDLKLAVVVDFPYGCSTTHSRLQSVRAYSAFADELDVVVQMPYVKSGSLGKVESDLGRLAETSHEMGLTLKVIVEDAYLTDGERAPLYRVVCKSGADFIKTSTGFADLNQAQLYGNQSTGAVVMNVNLMASTAKELGSDIGIKIAGGVRTLDDALKLLEASQRDLDPTKVRVGSSGTLNINEELENRLNPRSV